MDIGFENELISSRSNKAVKHLKSLSLSRNRLKEGRFLIEGVRIIEEAVERNCCVERLIITPNSSRNERTAAIIGSARDKGIETMLVADRVMDYLSETKTTQGIMAMVRPVEYEEDDLLGGQSPMVVVAHLLQDPGNLGTIIRVSEAAGAGGVVITPGTVDFYNQKALRATMGSIFRLPVVRTDSLGGFIGRFKKKGYRTVAAIVSAKTRYYELDYSIPTVLVLGQEATGLPVEAYSLMDAQVSIPMATMIDSLNVASAAGVILFEAARQRLTSSK